jgi:hypothetical protein
VDASPREPRRFGLAVALFLGLVLLLLGQAIAGDRDVYAGDLSFFEAPRDRFVARAIEAGEGIPRWAPGVYGGAPALGAPELGLLYPPNLLLAVLATERARALGIALHLVLAAFGARALARKLGADGAAATLAGLAFAFGGALVSSHMVLVYVRSSAWLPWALVGLLEATAAKDQDDALRPRAIPLATLGFLGMFLAGDPLGCAFAAVAGLALVTAGGGWRAGARLVERLVVVAAFTALLGAAQLLPAIHAVRESARILGVSYDVSARWSLWPPELLGLAVPFVFGAYRDDPARWFPVVSPESDRAWAEAYYLGPIVLALALAGASRIRKEPLARAGAALVLLFLPLALGRFTPLHAFLYSLPAGGLFRYPAKLFVPVSLGLGLLAAGGLRSLLTADPRARRVALGTLLAFGAVGAACALVTALTATSLGESIDARARALSVGATPGGPRDFSWVQGANAMTALAARLAHVAIVASAGFLVIVAGKRPGRLAAALLVLAALDLGIALRPAILLAPRAVVDAPPRAVPLLATLAGGDGAPARIDPTEAASLATTEEKAAAAAQGYRAFVPGDVLRANRGMGQGVLSQEGFLSSPPLRAARIAWELERQAEQKLVDPPRRAVLLGARYALMTEAEAKEYARDASPATAPFSGRVIVRLDKAPPWAALYETARSVDDLGGAAEAIRSPWFDPRSEVLIEGPVAPLAGGTPGSARLASAFGLHHFEVAVTAPRPAYLVVRESFAPGWTALVDGVETPVVPADARFRAVFVPAGSRLVTFTYAAPGARLGLAGSVLGAIALGALAWKNAKRARA